MRLPNALFAALALAALGACGPSKPPTGPDGGVAAFRGLVADPRQLAFTCVTPGCDTTLTVGVSSTANRRIAVKRMVLSDSSQTDFTVTPSEAAPFILGAASGYSIDVKYAPKASPATGAVNLLVTYTDASAEESPDRIEAGELVIPLVRRIVGEPLLTASPTRLQFGVVAVNATKTLPITVRNDGFGNLAMDIDVADAGHPDMRVALPTLRSLVPDAGAEVPVTFAPRAEEYVATDVQIGSTTPGAHPVVVTVEGTSFTTPRAAIEPEESALDFGEVPKGQARTQTVQLANHGGALLNVSSIGVSDGGVVSAALPGGAATAQLQALQRVPLAVTLNATRAGPVNATISVLSDDPVRSRLDLPVTGLVTEPKVQLTPATIDFGTVPMGWVLTRTVEIKNVGYGPLTVRRITMVGGSSNLFTLRNLPALPLTLARDARISVEVEFRAETAATFGGSVSVETDDASNPFAETQLAAVGGSCSAGCPIANGTPSCQSGTCQIGACNSNFYDTNKNASDGCECREVSPPDPGEFCSQALDKGTLIDNDHASTSMSGILHSEADVDFVRFYAMDASAFFTENYDVRIRLQSSDPNITMCIYRYDTGTHENGCFLNNESCPATNSYRRDGSLGPEDGADYYIKIFRKPNTTATCTAYTLFMSNG